MFQTQRRRVAALHKGAYCAYPERTSGTETVIKTGRRQKSARACTVSVWNVPKQRFAHELVRKNGKNNTKIQKNNFNLFQSGESEKETKRSDLRRRTSQ